MGNLQEKIFITPENPKIILYKEEANKMKKRLMALVLCAVLVLSYGGCSKKEKSTSAPESLNQTASADQTEDSADGDGESGFPISKEPITLTYYMKMNGAMSATMESYADVEYFKELEKKTNIHIEWNHNANDDAFALMIASGNLPDLINWPLGSAAGGVQSLLEDNVILDLTDLLPKYAPNYYSWLQANPEEDKDFKLDNGSYYQFVNFNADWQNKDIVYFRILGPQIRQDWLDAVNMDMPTTTDELYKVLCAFRDNDMNGDGDKTDEIPYVISSDMGSNLYPLAGSFGTRNDFQLLDGKIVYGPTSDNYKKFLTYMNKLYTEGLINTDFAVNADALNMILQNKAGFTIGSMGSSVIASHEALKKQNPDYNFISVPWLIGPDGYQSFTQDTNVNPRATAITSACKHVEEAMKWLDYAYSEEGSLNSTFGIEGKSYEMVDGYPTVMDSVRQNDKGWSEEQSISRWMMGAVNYPQAKDFRFYEQFNLNEDYKKDIQTNWDLAKTDITMPPAVFTTEEASTYSNAMSDIKTYVDECGLKFITGDMSLDSDWDTFVAKVESMGISKAQALKQAAYDRFLQR